MDISSYSLSAKLDHITDAYKQFGIKVPPAVSDAQKKRQNLVEARRKIPEEISTTTATINQALLKRDPSAATEGAKKLVALERVLDLSQSADLDTAAMRLHKNALVDHFASRGRAELATHFNSAAEKFMDAFNALGGRDGLAIDRAFSDPEVSAHVRTLQTEGKTMSDIRKAIDTGAKFGVVAEPVGFPGVDNGLHQVERITRYVVDSQGSAQSTSLPKWVEDPRLGSAQEWVKLLVSVDPQPGKSVALHLDDIETQERKAGPVIERLQAWAARSNAFTDRTPWSLTNDELKQAREIYLDRQRRSESLLRSSSRVGYPHVGLGS